MVQYNWSSNFDLFGKLFVVSVLLVQPALPLMTVLALN